MLLKDLTLKDFRSYAKANFTFSKDTTLIIGGNAAGKTNILEAIALLATGRSFRAERDREAIKWGEDVSRVTCHVLHHAEETKLELVLTEGAVGGQSAPLKKYLVNGVPRRQVDFVGNLRAVLFWPEDLELVTDSPSLRRKYLDSVLVQVDREYRRNFLSYERGLRQRNRLLDFINEGKAHRHQLLFWNQLLIKAGGYLTEKRTEFIEFINSYHVSHLSAQAGITYHLAYDKSVISDARLAQYAEEEVAAKATLVGPHRDDFEIVKCDTKYVTRKTDGLQNRSPITSHVSLSSYGSRGEQRLAILWLKLTELAYIEEKTGERPILLLDDIFSELDPPHRQLVLDLVGRQQTIVTSADPHIIDEVNFKEAKVIRL